MAVMSAMRDDRQFFDMGIQVGTQELDNQLIEQIIKYREQFNSIERAYGIKKEELKQEKEALEKMTFKYKQAAENLSISRKC